MTTIKQIPQELNFKIVQGDTLAFRLNVVDSEGDPADLDGYVVRAQVRRTPRGPLIAEMDVTVGAGYVDYILNDTDNLKGRYRWDTDFTINGDTRTKAAGAINVEPEITKDEP